MSEECLQNLISVGGLSEVAKDTFTDFHNHRQEVISTLDEDDKKSLVELDQMIASQHDLVVHALTIEAIAVVTKNFE